MPQAVQRPVTAPYRSDVHSSAWSSWDAYVEQLVDEGYPRSRVNTSFNRKLFMDGFVKGLQTPEK